MNTYKAQKLRAHTKSLTACFHDSFVHRFWHLNFAINVHFCLFLMEFRADFQVWIVAAVKLSNHSATGFNYFSINGFEIDKEKT